MDANPQLDIEDPPALLAYLRARGMGRGDVPPTVRVLAGGVSNRTVLVTGCDGRDLVIKQALPKLRVPDEWFCSTERVHREALAIELLQSLEPRGVVPALAFEDRSNHVVAMSAVPQPHENWKMQLLAGHIDEASFAQFGRLLAALQSVRPSADVAAELADRSFFEALRLEPYYLCSAQRVPEAAPFLHRLVDETRRRQDVLVHGDFSPKNLLVHDGRLTLLDFEVVHLGDAGFDMGFCLAHFMAKMLHLPAHRAALRRGVAAFLRAYRDHAGVAFNDDRATRAAAHAVGCLIARVAGRSQLEYLGPDEKRALREIAVALMPRRDVRTPEELVESFASSLCP